MADSEVSALTAVATPAGTDLFYVDQGGVPKKATLAQITAFASNAAGATFLVASSDASAKVKAAADYVCDGTADNVEIQAAHDALPSTGGRIVLSNGRFWIASQIQITKHGTVLEGQGYGDPAGWTEDSYGSSLYAVSGITGSVLRVSSGAIGTTAPLACVQIKNLVVDGAGGTTTPVGSAIDAIQFSSFNGLIQNVRTMFASGRGLYVVGKTTASTWSTYETRIDGLITNNNVLEGLYLDNYAEDLQIANVVCYSNKGDGIDDRGSSNQFVNVHCYDNGDGGGANGATNYNVYVASTVARSKFINCKFEHAEAQYGVYTAGWEISFTGCNFHNNGERWAAAPSSSVTFQDTGDTVTLNDHRLLNGDAVQFSAITSTTGISINTTYYVVGRTANTFQVSASVGGSALPLTTNGSGTLVRSDGGASRGQMYIAGGDVNIVGCQFGIKNNDYSVGAAIEIDAGASGINIDGCRFQTGNADTSGLWNGVKLWRDGPIDNPGDAAYVTLCGNQGAAGEQRVVYLGADHQISSTTGTRVIRARTLQPGTYRYRVDILFQSSSTTVGPQYGMNFTGTATGKHTLNYPGTGTTANTGIADDAGAALTGQLEESNTQTAFSSSTGNLSYTGVATANTNIHNWIEGIIIVTATGDLEFWHGSDAATATTVKAGTSMTINRVS